MAKDEIGAIIAGLVLGIIFIYIGQIFLTTSHRLLTTNSAGSLVTFYSNVGWGLVFAGSLLISGMMLMVFILIKHIRDNKTF